MSLPVLMRMFASLVLLAVLPPCLTILAQEATPEPNAPSPATRHAQVIAHGVTAMPAAEVGWRAVTERALPPGRSEAEERFPGFLLAHEGAIALTDDQGSVLTRIAPGEAVWVDEKEPYAVVSLEKKSVEYIAIALRPAENLGEGGLSLAIGLPFAAPAGEVFDIDLLRDALERNEEATIPAGLTPSLLVLTQGSVWVTAGGGEAVQVTAGGIGQIEGDAVIAGGSRSPATFVVARVGPALPARVGLKEARMATPVAGGTPVAIPETGTDRLWPEPTPDDPSLDTDSDGLTDVDESTLYGTEPRDADTDDDGLDDGTELLIHGTNPFLADTDGDGIPDNDEVDAGTNPLDAVSFPVEPSPTPETTPEVDEPVASPPALGTEPAATPSAGAGLDPEGDLDGDGLSNADETDLYGTDPAKVDTDGDLFSDGGEVVSGRNPLDPSDGS
jgi:hypothetical protein